MKPFSTFLSDLVGKMGQGTLADQLGIDGALLSRFRSGQGALCQEKIDKIFELAGACIVPCEEKRRMEDTLETISDLWRKERRKDR
jgi:hypothetical protein